MVQGDASKLTEDVKLSNSDKKSDFIVKEEEIFDNTGKSMGKAKVKRRPSVQPVAGHEVWSEYWVSKFIASGDIEKFQKCQQKLAMTHYMDPVIKNHAKKICSFKSLCVLYDRSVNQGPGKAISLLEDLLKSSDEKKFWNDYVSKQKDDIKTRVNHILKSDEIKWEDKYEI